ncbi:MAG: metallophosphoesterase [Clostridiales bacterium]|nr:metallophosphoesterase [Clostridiales bacterium]
MTTPSGYQGNRLFLAFVSLFVAFFTCASGASIPCQWTGVEKIVAVGDLHGDYENFVKILKGIGIVDDGLRWKAGRTHLVQTGDIMDRGPDARKILDLLMRLEKEAEQAGGMVHVLIGNHEEMNITKMAFRYPDYVTVDQFISFLPDGYRQRKENELRRRIINLQLGGNDNELNRVISEFWNSLRKDPNGQRQYLVNFNRMYGSWLLKKNAVIKINGIIFVHGGISERFSKWKIEDINDRLRLELADLRREAETGQPSNIQRPQVVYDEYGPLWYRELASVAEEDLRDEVTRILANLGAEKIVIAHTPRIAATKEAMKRFDGKVWVVDTGISRVYGGRLSALIIENGEFTVWGENHETTENTDTLHPCFLYVLFGGLAGFRAGR